MSRKTKAEEFVGEGFNLTVTGRNVLVTEAMKQYAIDKVSKLERFNLRIIDLAILMDIQKVIHKCDIVLKVDRMVVKSHAETDDMYASIDQAVDKLQRQLRRYHQRIREHQTKKLSAIEMNVEVLGLDEEYVNGTENQTAEELFKPHQVVKKDKMTLKTLTQAEAVMKMELSGNDFLLYRSEEDRKLKVIYRRNDGHYGIIEAES